MAHNRAHGNQADDGGGRCFHFQRGGAQNRHQLTGFHALHQAADKGAEKQHQAGIGEPAEVEGFVFGVDRQVDFAHQMAFQKAAHRTRKRAGKDDKQQDKAVHRPGFADLPPSEAAAFAAFGNFRIGHDKDNAGDAAQNRRRFRADKVGGGKLHRQRNPADNGGQNNIRNQIFAAAVGKKQNHKRYQKHQCRQLDNGIARHGMGLRGGHFGAVHFFGQRQHRHTHRTEAGGHAVADQRNQRGESGLETQSDQNRRRNRHRGAKARHAFEQAAEAPHNQQHLQALVAGNADKLLFDHVDLLAFQQHVVAEQRHQDND